MGKFVIKPKKFAVFNIHERPKQKLNQMNFLRQKGLTSVKNKNIMELRFLREMKWKFSMINELILCDMFL